MKMFFTTVIILSSISVAIYQIVRNVRYKSLADEKTRVAPVVMLMSSFAIAADIFAGTLDFNSLMADLMPAVVCMAVITSSLFDKMRIKPVVITLLSLELILLIWHFITLLGVSLMVPSSVYAVFVYVMSVFMTMLFIWAVLRRLKAVKAVMKTGTVWAIVTLLTDAVYMVFILDLVLLHQYIEILSFLMSGGILVALGIRVADDSVFVVWRRQERRIVESLKVTKVESVADVATIDELYQDIYERVVAYFENEKPFLDSELTINDLVKVIYSNKLYISRAISQFTGRNFCQFVNYYRITYAMECFRANPELRNHEMASMSGFNSIVTYNMAFRLFMGENPSDWCRKEKNRMIKHKK